MNKKNCYGCKLNDYLEPACILCMVCKKVWCMACFAIHTKYVHQSNQYQTLEEFMKHDIGELNK